MARLRPLRIVLEAVDRLTVPIDRVARRIDAARAPVARLQRSLSRLSAASGLSRIGTGLASLARRAAFASTAISALSIAGFKRFLDLGDSILTAADRIGISTDRLQELKFAADQNDLSFEELKKNLGFFVRGLGQANKHQGGLFNALKKTNPELLRQLIASKDVGEQLDLYADAIASATSAEGRARLSAAGFGRGGLRMVTVFQGGTRALREFAREAHSLGIVIDRDTLARAEELGDQWAKLRAITVGLAASVGAGLLPTVERITNRLVDWIGANQGLISTNVDQFATRVAGGIEAVAVATPKVIEALGGVPGIIDKIQSGVVALTGAAVALAAAWALTPMGQIALAGAGIAAVGLQARKRFREIGGFEGIGREFSSIGRDIGRGFLPDDSPLRRRLFEPSAIAGAPSAVGGTVQVIVSDDRVRVGKVTKSRGSPVDIEASTMVGELYRGRLLPGY